MVTSSACTSNNSKLRDISNVYVMFYAFGRHFYPKQLTVREGGLA